MLTRIARARGGTARALAYFMGYVGWNLAFRLLVLTLITFFLMSPSARFQDISDAYASNEITWIGAGALAFLFLIMKLNPLTSTSPEEVFSPYRMERRFIPGLLTGSVLAVGVVSAFLLSGIYRFYGYLLRLEEAPLVLAGIALRAFLLTAMVYCEEFIFRHKIMNSLRREMPDLWAACLTAILYCLVKAIQFDLGWAHLGTLFLISLGLSVRAIVDGDFTRGAGFWAGLLIVFHPLLSLPILGTEVQGVFLVKYNPASGGTDLSEAAATTFRLLTGGMGGPLSSFALQLMFALDVAQGIVRNKRLLLR